MSSPLISVIVPCYNAAKTVAETIASIQEQTVADFEIIAVDDGSTDSTALVLADIAATDARIKVVSRENGGISAARNTGINCSRGAFIAFLDADDLFSPDCLEHHLANLLDGGVGVSYGKVRHVSLDGRSTGQVTHPPLGPLRPGDLLKSNPCTSLIAVLRDVFEDVGLFNENLRRVEDQEWLFRVALSRWSIRGIDRILASYRITPGSVSSNVEAMLAAHGDFLDIARDLAPHVVKRHGRLARGSMLLYCSRRCLDHRGGLPMARRYFSEALSIAPDLILRRPRATIVTIVCCYCSGLCSMLNSQRVNLQNNEA